MKPRRENGATRGLDDEGKEVTSLRAIALFRSSPLEGYKSAVMEYGRWLMWHWERYLLAFQRNGIPLL